MKNLKIVGFVLLVDNMFHDLIQTLGISLLLCGICYQRLFCEEVN